MTQVVVLRGDKGGAGSKESAEKQFESRVWEKRVVLAGK
jgi:hypothetical protein